MGEAGCPDNRIPILHQINYQIWDLFLLMLPGLIQKDGYDFTAIQVVFDTHEINGELRRAHLKSVTILIDVIEKERRKRANNG